MTDNSWKEKFRSLLLAVERLNGRMSVSVNFIDTVCSVHVQRISQYTIQSKQTEVSVRQPCKTTAPPTFHRAAETDC